MVNGTAASDAVACRNCALGCLHAHHEQALQFLVVLKMHGVLMMCMAAMHCLLACLACYATAECEITCITMQHASADSHVGLTRCRGFVFGQNSLPYPVPSLTSAGRLCQLVS